MFVHKVCPVLPCAVLIPNPTGGATSVVAGLQTNVKHAPYSALIKHVFESFVKMLYNQRRIVAAVALSLRERGFGLHIFEISENDTRERLRIRHTPLRSNDGCLAG